MGVFLTMPQDLRPEWISTSGESLMNRKGRYGRLKKTVSSFVFMAMFLFPVFCSAERPSRVDLLVEQAISERLYEEDYWLVLLHYKKGLSGFKSLIDDPDFFISKNGKQDPASELEATLRSFFQKDKENQKRCFAGLLHDIIGSKKDSGSTGLSFRMTAVRNLMRPLKG